MKQNDLKTEKAVTTEICKEAVRKETVKKTEKIKQIMKMSRIIGSNFGMQQMKNRFRGETAKYIRIVLLVIYDILAIFLAEIFSIWTRFDFSLKSEQGIPFLETALQYFWVNMIVTIVIFFIMHLYNSLWEYASVQELLNVVIACLLSAAIQSLGMHMFQWNMPRSYYILYFFFLLALVSGSRFVYRGLRIIRHSYLGDASRHAIATMVIGAGDSANS